MKPPTDAAQYRRNGGRGAVGAVRKLIHFSKASGPLASGTTGHSQQIERAPKSNNVRIAPNAIVSDQNAICR
jgi:hypothetical protein